MRRKIWGKNVVALALSAALAVGSVAPISAQAEGIAEDITLGDEQNEADVNEDAVSDGNAEGTEADTENNEDVSNEASETEETSEETASEEVNEESSENSDAAEEDTEANDETKADEESDAAVTDGNAQTQPEVTGGDAEVSEDGSFDYEETVEGYKIKLHAESGIVPEGTTVSIKKVTKSENGEKVDDLVNEALPADAAVYDSASFDITLLKDGQEFEPEGVVSVEITLDEKLADVAEENESVSVQVFHIEDNNETTEVPVEVSENATDVHSDEEETVVSYDAESFSIYNVSAVATFETSEPLVYENPCYENFITLSDSELQSIADNMDSSINIKTVNAHPDGSRTSIEEVADVIKNAVKTRQSLVTVNIKLLGSYSTYSIYDELMPVLTEHTGVPNEGDYLRWSYVGHGLQTSTTYVNGMTCGTVQMRFLYTDNASLENQAAAAISNTIAQQGWANLPTDIDKINAVYGWMIANIRYDPKYEEKEENGNYISHSCYSAIVTKDTVCQGYSMLFYRIMLNLGIGCRMITGNGNYGYKNTAHAWNIVQVGEKYYFVDSTWDASPYQKKYGWKTKNANNKTNQLKFLKTASWYLKGNRDIRYDGEDFDEYHERWDECNTADFRKLYPVYYYHYGEESIASLVKPSSVSISQTSATLRVGATMQLTAACQPATATQGIRWNSNNPKVATVNDAGVVTGIKNGEVVIFATSVYGDKKASCRILVTDGRAKEISVPSVITVYAGSKVAINPTIFPSWSGSPISYRCSNWSVAKVNGSGIVTGRKAGRCTITVSATGVTSKYVSVIVKKAKRVKSIKLSKKKIKLKVGKSKKLKVKFSPKKSTNKNVIWKSTKPSVVSVDANGRITALKKGKAKIVARSEDGSHKATCVVKVK